MLRVKVSQFGPIIEGTVNLKPLTVFVGPNNSGKSYFAMLLYALYRAYGTSVLVSPLGPMRHRARPYRPFMFWAQRHLEHAQEAKELLNSLTGWLKQIQEQQKTQVAYHVFCRNKKG